LLAAQPVFLYVLCFGSIVHSMTILVISYDESYGWDEQQLSRACMAIPWLFCIGHIITYGTLFSKLWRVNRVLQFSRRRVGIRHVLWPSALLFAAAVLILSLWTALDSLQWERTFIDDSTGESIGRCKSENIAAFVTPLVVIMIIPTCLTAYMAWKTRDVDDAYSESIWIFVLVLVQLEVILFAAPLIVILEDLSTTGNYIGLVLISWTFPMSTLLLIMIPKYIAFYRAVHGIDHRDERRGDATGGVRVTGMSDGTTNKSSQSGDVLRAAPDSTQVPHSSGMSSPAPEQGETETST